VDEKSPVLFGELIGRLQSQLKVERIRVLLSTDLLATLFNSLDSVKANYKCYSCLIIYADLLVNERSLASVCFSDSNFIASYVDLLANAELTSLIRSRLLIYFRNCDVSDFTIHFLQDYCCQRIHSLKDAASGSNRLACHFFPLLTEVFATRPELISAFPRIFPALLDFLTGSPPPEVLTAALSLMVEFALANPNFEWSGRYVVDLTKRLQEAHPDGAPQSLLLLLLTLLTMTRITVMTTRFLIENYVILPAILCLFLDSNERILRLLANACTFSHRNYIQCHNGKVDSILLGIIQIYPEDFHFGGYTFKHRIREPGVGNEILPFLLAISHFKTTPQIMTSYLGLLVPNRNGYFHPQSQKILAILSQQLGKESAPEIRAEYLRNELFVPPEKIQHESLLKGMTYSFWVFNDYHLAQHFGFLSVLLYDISDVSGNRITLILHRDFLHCYFHFGAYRRDSLFTKIEWNQWQMVTMAIQITSNSVGGQVIDVSFVIGRGILYKKNVSVPGFQSPQLAVRIGGFASEVDLKYPFCLLGPFRAFPGIFVAQTIDLLYSHGHGLGTQFDLLAKRSEMPLTAYRPMSRILREFPVYESIFPLISYASSMPPRYLEMTIELLTKLTHIEHFREFPIIGLLLHKCDSKVLTHSLFLQFCSLLQSSRNEVLMHSIVFNFQLWSIAPFHELKHILMALPTCLQSLPIDLHKFIAFQHVLTDLRVFFWKTHTESTVIERDPRRDPKLDFQFCRSRLNEFLIELSKFHFTIDDEICVVSHILSCRDDQQVISLLSLFRALPRPRGSDSQLSLLLIHRLPSSKSTLFIELLRTVLIQGDRLLTTKLAATKINSNHFSLELLSIFLPCILEFPETLLLFSIIAANVGLPASQIMCETIEALVSDPEWQLRLAGIDHWYVWPILAGFQLDGDAQTTIARLASSVINMNHSLELCDRICGFCHYMSFFGSPGIIWMNVLKNCLEFGADIIPRVIVMLFFSGQSMHNERLNEFMRSSPFDLSELIQSSKYRVKSMAELADLIKTGSRKETCFHVDVQVDGALRFVEFFDPFLNFLRDFEQIPIVLRLKELMLMVHQQYKRPSRTHFDWTGIIDQLLPAFNDFLSESRLTSLDAVIKALDREFCHLPAIPSDEISSISMKELAKTKKVRSKRNFDSYCQWRSMKSRIVNEASIWRSTVFSS
jgi:hypothetical protein